MPLLMTHLGDIFHPDINIAILPIVMSVCNTTHISTSASCAGHSKHLAVMENVGSDYSSRIFWGLDTCQFLDQADH